jgi:hypothetical protein
MRREPIVKIARRWIAVYQRTIVREPTLRSAKSFRLFEVCPNRTEFIPKLLDYDRCLLPDLTLPQFALKGERLLDSSLNIPAVR